MPSANFVPLWWRTLFCISDKLRLCFRFNGNRFINISLSIDIFFCHLFFLSPHSQSFVCFQSLIFHLRYLLHFLITSFPSHSFSFLPSVHPFFHAVIHVFCSQMPFSPHCPPLRFYFLTFCLSSEIFLLYFLSFLADSSSHSHTVHFSYFLFFPPDPPFYSLISLCHPPQRTFLPSL